MRRNTAQEWPQRSPKCKKVHNLNLVNHAAFERRTGHRNGEMEMSKLGKKLIAAAKEGVAIARGEMDPASYRLHVPAKINVRAMRQKLGMTQEEFAIRYGLTLARVRDWEQGRSAPDGAARAYLRVIEKEPEAVDRALAVA